MLRVCGIKCGIILEGVVNVDHVYIDERFRSGGIGKQLFAFIEAHVTSKGCEAIELNTYVQNSASHKFYYNLGFKILGFHFLKEI